MRRACGNEDSFPRALLDNCHPNAMTSERLNVVLGQAHLLRVDRITNTVPATLLRNSKLNQEVVQLGFLTGLEDIPKSHSIACTPGLDIDSVTDVLVQTGCRPIGRGFIAVSKVTLRALTDSTSA